MQRINILNTLYNPNNDMLLAYYTAMSGTFSEEVQLEKYINDYIGGDNTFISGNTNGDGTFLTEAVLKLQPYQGVPDAIYSTIKTSGLETIYFGTTSGVLYINGVSVLSFSHSPEVSSNTITLTDAEKKQIFYDSREKKYGQVLNISTYNLAVMDVEIYYSGGIIDDNYGNGICEVERTYPTGLVVMSSDDWTSSSGTTAKVEYINGLDDGQYLTHNNYPLNRKFYGVTPYYMDYYPSGHLTLNFNTGLNDVVIDKAILNLRYQHASGYSPDALAIYGYTQLLNGGCSTFGAGADFTYQSGWTTYSVPLGFTNYQYLSGTQHHDKHYNDSATFKGVSFALDGFPSGLLLSSAYLDLYYLPQSSTPLYINGAIPSVNSGIDLYLAQNTSSGVADLFIQGYDNSSGNIPLYLLGGLHESGTASLYLLASDVSNSGISLFLANNYGLASMNLFLQSTLGTLDSGSMSLFLWSTTNSGLFTTIPLYLENSNTLDPRYAMNLVSSGGGYLGNPSSTMNLYLRNDNSVNSGIPLYLSNEWVSSTGIIPLYINTPSGTDGAVPFSGTMNLYLSRQYDGVLYSMPLYIAGPVTSTSGISMYISGEESGVYGEAILYISGIDPEFSYVSMYTRGI